MYRYGELCGEGRVELEGGDWLEVTYQRGAVHGLVRRRTRAGRVTWLGRYCRGRQRGGAWHFQPGGGVITGPGDTSSYTVTGDQATYLYPDLATCLTGAFSQSCLVTATQARLTSIKHTDTGVRAVELAANLREVFIINTRAFSWLKLPYSAFKLKNLSRRNAKQQLDVKFGHQRKDHLGRAF